MREQTWTPKTSLVGRRWWWHRTVNTWSSGKKARRTRGAACPPAGQRVMMVGVAVVNAGDRLSGAAIIMASDWLCVETTTVTLKQEKWLGFKQVRARTRRQTAGARAVKPCPAQLPAACGQPTHEGNESRRGGTA